MNKYYRDLFLRRMKEKSYRSREERQEFIGFVFKELLGGKILDVGCFNGDLRRFVKGSYVGLDFHGKPDIRLDLDSGFLPFKSRVFDTVVCTDVLEHLENIHQVFDECIRVSRSYVVISLPNCYGGFWRPLFFGKYIDSYKYYGLPIEKPIDRHRWYFSASEAGRFIRRRSAMNGAEALFLYYLDTTSWRTKAALWPFLLLPEQRKNLLTTSVWAVISVEQS
jgi:SAM-dependent methyltransferase